MNNHIYGFSGKIGVGKNYIAEKIFGKQLYDLGYKIHILAFGDQVKYEIGSRLSIIENNKKFTDEMDNIYNELFINKTTTTRKKLQYYGTNYCRNGDNWNINNEFTLYNQPEIWIKSLYLQIKNILNKSYNTNKDIFIITDIRFINEADFVKNLGGKIIRIIAPNRNQQKILEEAQKTINLHNNEIKEIIEKIKSHQSEIELDNYNFDYYINNEKENDNVEKEIMDIINMTSQKY
jgi:putative protein kinase ArgK-like GTPase of G3E family